MKMSISFVTKTNMTSLKHNNRELTEAEYQEPAHKHIKQDRSNENIYIKRGNLKETYDELFGGALEKYNDTQKRADRKITDYFQHVKKSKTLDLQREIVVTVGKKEDWENLSLDDKKAVARQLEAYINEFEQRHTHLHIYNAVIHMDEAGAPHAHFNIVPVADGYKKGLEKQPSFKKALQNEGYKEKGRGQLKEFRDKEILCLEEKLQSLGIERQKVGTNDIKDMREYKQIVGQANKELDEKLVSKYGAPEYINETTGEYYDWLEYHNFLEFPSEEQEGQIARETTYAEKVDWVKQHQQQDLNKLESSQKLSEARISELDKKIKEKSEELSKIDFMASERLSELSELELQVKTLETGKDGLGTKLEGLQNEIEVLETEKQQKLEQLGSISDNELDSIRPKKGLLGSKIELSPEQWKDFKGSYYKARNEAREMKQLAKMYAQKNQALTNGDRFQNSLNKAKTEVKDSRIINLQNALKDKDKTISVLEQKNKKLLGVAKQYMPQKMFQNLLEELQMIKPIVKVVRTVKSLFKD